MTTKKRRNGGFSMAELLIVVAILAILGAVAFVFVNPREISVAEYDKSAESIATAAQNRLTALRNAGELTALQSIGIPKTSTSTGEETKGGERYVFSRTTTAANSEVNPDIYYILPAGSIDVELNEGYYAIGFLSDSGLVSEVFYSATPFKEHDPSYLQQLASDPQLRKTDGVGYYAGAIDDAGEVAFAQLPTPQLTISNYENLVLSIYLPKVKELETIGKKIAIRISLSDEDGEAVKKYSLDELAIYRTYSYGGKKYDQENNGIKTGATYKIILDTPDPTLNGTEIDRPLALNGGDPANDVPKGKFETWAEKTKAYTEGKEDDENLLKLGDDATITVTVFALYDKDNSNYDENNPIDPTYMPRSATVTFCSWFETYSGGAVTIACGRHLQNLAYITEINSDQKKNLPKVTKNADGTYVYSDYDRGKAYLFTDKGSGKSEKYTRRKGVKSINTAKQVKAIDFNCAEWKSGGKQIPFTPINLRSDFKYYGNYLTIKHLYVDADFYGGLFGYIYNSCLYDVLLVNPHVESHMPMQVAEMYEMGVGSLVGTSRASQQIYNCQAYLEAENGKYNHEDYRVQGKCYVGGLIGFCEDEYIRQNSASIYTGYEDGTSKYVGGLIGAISGDGDVKRCYGAGLLSGQYVGGLIGTICEDTDNSGDDYVIESCYTAGHIERAKVSAAGLVGLIDEQGGYTKSALRAHQNYCVVIYGEETSGKYEWKSKDSDGKDVPIYGTFEGDGFEWLYAGDAGYISGSFKDEEGNSLFGGYSFFFGADFESDNENYYIPQDGITYSNSPYFEAVKAASQKLLDAIEKAGTDVTKVKKAISDNRAELAKQKNLRTLEAIKDAMEKLIAEFEAEETLDKNNKNYNAADKMARSEEIAKDKYKYYEVPIYLAQNRARITYDNHSSEDGCIKVNALQALKMIYDGTNPDGKGGKVTISYQGSSNTNGDYGAYSDSTSQYSSSDTNHTLINYTFMGLYDLVKDAYKNNKTELLGRLFGKNNNYQDGFIYKYFYDDMLYGLFNKIKNYYEYVDKDETGEYIYRYYRDRFVKDKIGNLFNSMAVETDALKSALQEIKAGKLDQAIKVTDWVKKVADSSSGNWNKWEEVKDKDGNTVKQKVKYKEGDEENSVECTVYTGMKPFKAEVLELANAASSALDTLKTALEGVTAKPAATTTPEKMQTASKTAYDAFYALYKYFDTDNVRYVGTDGNIIKGTDGKEVSDFAAVTDKDKAAAPVVVKDMLGETLKLKKNGDYNVPDRFGNYEYEEKTDAESEMCGLRDVLKYIYPYVDCMGVALNSGVEGEIDRLEYMLGLSGISSADQTKAIEECKDNICVILGQGWENCDSGHRIYSEYELRRIRQSDAGGGNHLNSDFEYDYHDVDGYKKLFTDHSYVDEGHVFNNVFPYRETAETGYYPFPMIVGMAVQDTETVVTSILFHYGDWLTSDLRATDPGEHTYHEDTPETANSVVADISKNVNFVKGQIEAAMPSNSDTSGNGKAVDTLKGSIDKLVTKINELKDANPTSTQIADVCTELQTVITNAKAAQKACEKPNGNTGKQDAAGKVYDLLTEYIPKLEELLKSLSAFKSGGTKG